MTRPNSSSFCPAAVPLRYAERPHVGFSRATRKRPCRVCGATKYCQETRDGVLAHCMKESTGAVKRAKDGGYIHVLVEGSGFRPASPRLRAANGFTDVGNDMTNPTLVAPLEIRDAAYRQLLLLSPASRYARELVTASPDGLLARGLLPEDVARFGALPPRVAERDALAKVITLSIEETFAAYVRGRNCSGCVGVPGFWEAPPGQVKLGRDYDYKRPALVIPYRDPAGRIQACQLRFAGRRGGYHWLSTPEDRLDCEPKGTSSGTPLHWTATGGKDHLCDELPILITEGALKAEVFVRLRPPMCAVATAGVGVSHAEVVGALRGRDVLIGFDSDHRRNEQVCRQLGKLIAEREMDVRASGREASTGVVVWEGPKGIDEAARQNARMRVVSVGEWAATLTGKPSEEVDAVWSSLSFSRLAPSMNEVVRPAGSTIR